MQEKAVEFQLRAALGYETVFDWYLQRSEVAASRFIAEVQIALAAIGENPQRWPQGYSKIYSATLPLFADLSRVPVKDSNRGCRSWKRRPDYWKDRL